MKKAVSVLLCMVLVVGTLFAVSGCTKQGEIKSDIVLITDGGTITDGGYNQSAWEGVNGYAGENRLSARYYQPVLDNGEVTVRDTEKYIELSAKNGAEYIVLPGESFAVSAFELAPKYKNVKFILLDAQPHSADNDRTVSVDNVMSVSFDALQSGFLAGYIAVSNGNKKLGFFGEENSNDSANYGAGFVQGAAYAADELGIPVTLDWADYDSSKLNYNYDFTITAHYNKISDVKEKMFTVKVENGTGTGTYTEGSNVTIIADPAPFGKTFDKWEIKSDTEGVKDKKVNVSSKTNPSMNLLVEKCDCTLTATYKDIEETVYSVKTMSADGASVYFEQSAGENANCDISAPVAPENMVFDHWDCSVDGAVEDKDSKDTKVNVTNTDVTVTPIYVKSDTPTFNMTVNTGEGGAGESKGSGSYVAGDTVTVVAAVPAEGYMFSHWSNEDSYGQGTGIAMENEYYGNTSFEMIDRYASVCESMYDHGATMVFAGGNSKSASALTAKWNYDYELGVIAAGANNKDAYTTIVKNYGEAVKNCLADFKGGITFAANCKTEGIYATYVSDDEKIQKKYDTVYKSLAEGKIALSNAGSGKGNDFCKTFNEKKSSDCLTLNAWFV